MFRSFLSTVQVMKVASGKLGFAPAKTISDSDAGPLPGAGKLANPRPPCNRIRLRLQNHGLTSIFRKTRSRRRKEADLIAAADTPPPYVGGYNHNPPPSQTRSVDQLAPGENNFRIAPALAFAAEDNRLPGLQQGDLCVLGGFSDQRLPAVRGENGLVIVRVVKDRNDPSKPVRGFQEDIIFADKHPGLEPFDHAFDAEGFFVIAPIGGGRIVFELLHQLGGTHNIVRLQRRQLDNWPSTFFTGGAPRAEAS